MKSLQDAPTLMLAPPLSLPFLLLPHCTPPTLLTPSFYFLLLFSSIHSFFSPSFNPFTSSFVPFSLPSPNNHFYHLLLLFHFISLPTFSLPLLLLQLLLDHCCLSSTTRTTFSPFSFLSFPSSSLAICYTSSFSCSFTSSTYSTPLVSPP